MTCIVEAISSTASYIIHFLLFPVVFFLTSDNLVGLQWYFIMVLIYISLMANNVKHLFRFLFITCMSSSIKYLVIYFPHLLTALFSLLLFLLLGVIFVCVCVCVCGFLFVCLLFC